MKKYFELLEDGNWQCKLCGAVLSGIVYRMGSTEPHDDDAVLLNHLDTQHKRRSRFTINRNGAMGRILAVLCSRLSS